MTKFAQIILPNALNDDFTYFALDNQQIGDVVLVEFGRQKLWSVVISLHDDVPSNFDVKKIKKVLEIHPKLKLTLNQVKFIEAISSYNLASRGLVLKSFIGILNSDKVQKEFTPLEHEINEKNFHLKTLLPDQQKIYNEICQDLKSSQTFLIDGVTGSGKTEIYLRAVAEALRRGRSAIVLVPEIALTPQTLRRFMARFAGRVAVLHSRLTPNERYDSWRRVRSGALDVVIGPRSALFAPLPDVGVIVVDEAHDQAYWQDSVPYYHARAAAIERARQCAAVCILGSATPDVVDSFRAQHGMYTLLALPRRILAHVPASDKRAAVAQYAPLPPVHVVDMRHELRAGNRSIFSRLLTSQLAQVLQRGEQAILFLNRRGQATYVFCRDCGHVLQCPKCSIAYTFHAAPERLLCHHCNAQRAAPAACPQCKSARIRHFGLGTEAVESGLQAAFPGVRAVRWDADSTRQRGAHAAILQQFAAHAADVLIGTQMIAKGLDLPLVTLVGVVSADTGLALPDYRASERVFSVLLQVAGRAGRGQRAGQVVLQTYQPEHFAIQAAAAHDYAAFYKQELALRRKHGYPPFGRVARLVGQHLRADELQAAAQALGAALHAQRAADVDIIGPVPCFYQRVNGMHRWQIVLRGAQPAALLDVALPAGWRVEVDPVSLL